MTQLIHVVSSNRLETKFTVCNTRTPEQLILHQFLLKISCRFSGTCWQYWSQNDEMEETIRTQPELNSTRAQLNQRSLLLADHKCLAYINTYKAYLLKVSIKKWNHSRLKELPQPIAEALNACMQILWCRPTLKRVSNVRQSSLSDDNQPGHADDIHCKVNRKISRIISCMTTYTQILYSAKCKR